MKQTKYKLPDFVRGYLRKMRKDMQLSAEDISVELGYSKAWLGQIERGKLHSIKEADLVKLLLIYLPDKTEDDIIEKGILENFFCFFPIK